MLDHEWSPPDYDPLFPQDLFTPVERKEGAILLHWAGAVYMFFAICVVYYEYFLPALAVPVNHFKLSAEVAASTVIAVGQLTIFTSPRE